MSDNSVGSLRGDATTPPRNSRTRVKGPRDKSIRVGLCSRCEELAATPASPGGEPIDEAPPEGQQTATPTQMPGERYTAFRKRLLSGTPSSAVVIPRQRTSRSWGDAQMLLNHALYRLQGPTDSLLGTPSEAVEKLDRRANDIAHCNEIMGLMADEIERLYSKLATAEAVLQMNADVIRRLYESISANENRPPADHPQQEKSTMQDGENTQDQAGTAADSGDHTERDISGAGDGSGSFAGTDNGEGDEEGISGNSQEDDE